ncbi:hypothetical protein [Liquorilactobacillus hordei]|uniref:hypothetical protein n=1 Tax=Liquorilactobacillus hordei TaxID=468911 RepID=UPI0039EA6C30
MEKISITDDIVINADKTIQKNALIAILRDINSVEVNDDELYDIFKTIYYGKFIKTKIGDLTSRLMFVVALAGFILIIISSFMSEHAQIIIISTMVIAFILAEILNFCYNSIHYTWEDVPRGYGVCDFNMLLPSNDVTFYKEDIEEALVRLRENNRVSTRKYSTSSIGIGSYSDKTALTMVWVLYKRHFVESYMPNIVDDIKECDYADLICAVTNNKNYMESIEERNINFYNWVERQAELIDR